MTTRGHLQSAIRNYFIAGLLTLLPVVITLSVLVWLFHLLDSVLGWAFTLLLGRTVPGLGLATSFLLVFVTGIFATNVLGRRMMGVVDRLMMQIPVARTIYSATKQLSDSILLRKRGAFQKVVLVEWPRKGLFTLGFVTGETVGEAQEKTAERVFNVFIVTTPNPTTGFLVLVPESEIIPLEMKVEDGLKMVISGGIVTPPDMSQITIRNPL
ncbi:MAG: DUF502 domain-containing protein [Armatimonadota bacterium]|nr:DUF502 domain-containing protein [Armatimonadota bacterium]MDR5704138.1 DUF502 domain-containing protein [Armatimonadota bacterium]